MQCFTLMKTIFSGHDMNGPSPVDTGVPLSPVTHSAPAPYASPQNYERGE